MNNGHNVRGIIAALGGVTAVARLLRLRQPSVSEWLARDRIPTDKLIRLAPRLEAMGVATRWELFPADYASIWPEVMARQTIARRKACRD